MLHTHYLHYLHNILQLLYKNLQVFLLMSQVFFFFLKLQIKTVKYHISEIKFIKKGNFIGKIKLH